jgi:hypothetical protein
VSSPTERRPHTEYVFAGCTIALLILAAGIYFGPQTLTYWRLRPDVTRPCDQPPRGWCSVPRPLEPTATSAAQGSVLSYYGYKFEIPWKDRDKEVNDGQWIEITFKTGQSVRFLNPALFQYNPISGHISQGLKETFGPVISESKYQQFKEVVSVTPSQWSPFRSRNEFARVRGLLEIKGLWFEHSPVAPDIYSFETNSFQGFEISGLSHDWQEVGLNLFDSTDRWFRVNIVGNAQSGVRFTQSEVDLVIQSFGPVASK